MSNLSIEYLNECFEYMDGVLLWKERPSHHFANEWHRKVFNARQSGKKLGV